MAENVGNAYLNVVPRMSGNASALGSKFGTEMSGGLKSAVSAGAVAMGNILSNAVTSIASTVGGELSKTLWNYADYEQLVGGVDTIFKEASSTVQANAKRAFATAGMSANEYMQNVTGFSSSLIQSLGGNTSEAAKVANRAMIDMSDNANKMGTDMGRITDAYQGFAKQNYTMLDNLKLGYGGTKTEMARLIEDASKMTDVQKQLGVEVDASSMSFGNIVNAISVMQTSMGIAGTTMEEGATTISGSLNMLKGAWDNFLTAIGDGGQTMDMGVVVNDLLTSLGAVASNIGPALVRIGESIAVELPPIIGNALAGLPTLVQEQITNAFGAQAGGAFGGVMNSIRNSFAEIMPMIEGVLAPAMQTAQDNVASTLGAIGGALGEAVKFVVDNVLPTISDVLAEIMPIVQEVGGAVQEALPPIQEAFGGVMSAIGGVVKDVWPPMSRTVTSVLGAIRSAVQVAMPIIKTVIGTAFNAVKAVVKTVWPVIRTIVTGAVSGITGAIRGISGVVSAVSNTFGRIRDAISGPINKAKEIVKGAIDAITGFFRGAKLELPKFKLPHFRINGGQLPWGIGGKGTPPSISVDWYARGGMAGLDGAQLIGAGERGPELVWPSYEPYISKYADAIASRMGGGSGIVINLNYSADADANELVRDIARGIQRYKMAGAF